MLSNPSHSIHITYGSESGNAKNLALRLHALLQSHKPQLYDLNQLNISDLTKKDVLLIITSSFGDGEAPGNATAFFDNLIEQKDASLDFSFAVFGLGDVSYPKFCGFSIELESKLQQMGAKTIARRVDSDINYNKFFAQWSNCLQKYFKGEPKSLENLHLQVKAYNKDQSFLAKVESVKRINESEFPAYDIKVDITDSGMSYQAGDLLYVIPPVNEITLARIIDFYGYLTDHQKQELSKKELRQLTKPLIRAFAKQTKSSDLKTLTKMSASNKLAQYVYGRDISNLLHDYCSINSMPFESLIHILSDTLPRAYSIASCGLSSKDSVRLCIRDVNYYLDELEYAGSASHFLCHATVNSDISIYIRANQHFHLPKDTTKPIIMIGAGTGIAPYLGFLQQRQTCDDTGPLNSNGEAHLFFGERYRQQDFLYESELKKYVESGQLTAVYTAFSRDQDKKIYVQDVLLEQGAIIWNLLEKEAEIYVCGSKINLGKSIDNAISLIAQKYGKYSEENAIYLIQKLINENRYHRDLY